MQHAYIAYNIHRLITSTQHMKAASSYETLLSTSKTKQRHNTEDSYLKRNFVETSSLGMYELIPVLSLMLLETV
jgi:hypothetical protein